MYLLTDNNTSVVESWLFIKW